MNVPDHKRVIITQGGVDVLANAGLPKAVLVFDDELALNISTDYGSIIETKPSTLLNLLAGGASFLGNNVPSGQFSLQGLQVWKDTQPLEFNLGLKLYMDTSGVLDVVRPAIVLAKLAVPSKTEDSKGNLGFGLIPPGPTIQDILNLAGVTQDSDVGKILNTFAGFLGVGIKNRSGLVDVEIGKFFFLRNCVLTKVVPNFSEAKDEDLAPIYCELSIDFRTSEVATTQMLDGLYKH